MSQMQVLRAVNYPRMPWKNGGGSTEEIARDAGEGLDGFGWRLSIADIAESGGFSSFVGYQRIITVLQGDGMELQVDGEPSRALLPFDAFMFSGESQVACRLLGGPIRDFNLIYSPQRYRARLQWLDGESRLYSSAQTLLVFAAGEQVRATLGGHAVQMLSRHDCLQVDGNAGLQALELSGHCCLIELSHC